MIRDYDASTLHQMATKVMLEPNYNDLTTQYKTPHNLTQLQIEFWNAGLVTKLLPLGTLRV